MMKEFFEQAGEHWAVTIWIGLVVVACFHGDLTLINIGRKEK
jgi:hypothetical protein